MPISEERKAELLRRYGANAPAKPVVLTAPQKMTEQQRNAILLDMYSEAPAKPTLTEERKAELLTRYGKQQSEKDLNIIERIGASSLGEAIGGSIQKSADIMANPRLGVISKALQVGGQGVDIASAPIAAGMSAAYGALPEGVRQPINKFAGNVAQTVGDKYKAAIDGLTDTRIGKAIGEYGMESPRLREGMQVVSDDLSAIAKMASFVPVGKAATTATKPVAGVASEGLEKTGGALAKWGDKSADAARTEFATKLYTPKETPTAVAKMAGDIEVSGWNQAQKYAPNSPYKIAAIDDLKNLPIKSSNTMQKNYNIVKAAKEAEQSKLFGELKSVPTKYKESYLNNKLDVAANQIAGDARIYGSDKDAFLSPFQAAKEIAAQNPKTPEGLLQSRIEFDKWATDFAPKTYSDATGISNAKEMAVKRARAIMNETVAEIAPNVDVAGSLAKQSHYIDAMKNIGTKLSSAPKTRAAQIARSIIPDNLRARIGSGSSFIAGGAIGASSSALPALVAPAVGAVTGYGLYKATVAPSTRKALGKAIMASGKIIKPQGK